MNKSQFQKTLPLPLSYQSSQSNLLTQIYNEPLFNISQSILMINMKRNTFKHNFIAMKSCFEDLQWIFQECKQIIEQASLKEPLKSSHIRFNNLVKELNNLRKRFSLININKVSQSYMACSTQKKHVRKPSCSYKRKQTINGECTLPLNYKIQFDSKTQKNSKNKLHKIPILQNKQNQIQQFQILKTQNSQLKQLLTYHKKSQIKVISKMKQVINSLKDRRVDQILISNQLEKTLKGFLEFQKQSQIILQGLGNKKSIGRLELKRNKLQNHIQQLKFQQKMIKNITDPLNKTIVKSQKIPTYVNEFDAHYMMLLQAQTIEKLLG